MSLAPEVIGYVVDIARATRASASLQLGVSPRGATALMNTARAWAGMDHSYVFAEWNMSRLDGFGSNTSMDVGSDTWLLGVAVEVTF